MTFADFHFLRPEWLWALIPAAAIGWMLIRRRSAGATDGWLRHVDSHLLQHLAISGTDAKRSRLNPVIGAAMVATLILGLAGPAWEKNSVPSFEGGEPVVAVLSLAQSMNADDLTPTRLKRSVHKLRDVLERTKGDQRGLVIYSDAPFVAAPLTSDPKVIEQMLPELSTTLMPVLGNRLDLAIGEAQQMLERAGATRGQIIVMADDAGNDPATSIASAKAAKQAGYTVSVLGAGTVEGATLQTADGRAIAARDGQTFMTRLSKDDLQNIATAGGGAFSMITPGGADLDHLLPATANSRVAAGDQQDFQADSWVDMGYWLLFLPFLLIPFAFRRGLVFGLALMISTAALQPGAARAGAWDDLWATPDQQGRTAFETSQFGNAAALFDTPEWQATAAYRAGDFAGAAQGFAEKGYNLGNALAKSGRFEDAIAAYDAALDTNPDDIDAQYNRDLVAELLKQQEQEEQQQTGDPEQQQEDSDPSQDQQSGGEQNQQSQGSDPQDQQGSDQQQSQEGQPQDSDSGEQQQSQSSDGSKQSETEGAQEQGTEQQSAEQSGSEEQGEQDQQNAESGQPAEQQTQDMAGNEAPGAEQTDTAQETPETDQKGLSERLSDLLTENTEDTPQDMVEASLPGARPLDQAVEQQLRRVPDDPSGLLRARIRQHYAQIQAGS